MLTHHNTTIKPHRTHSQRKPVVRGRMRSKMVRIIRQKLKDKGTDDAALGRDYSQTNGEFSIVGRTVSRQTRKLRNSLCPSEADRNAPLSSKSGKHDYQVLRSRPAAQQVRITRGMEKMEEEDIGREAGPLWGYVVVTMTCSCELIIKMAKILASSIRWFRSPVLLGRCV
jgi:hypothetical protein